MKLVRALLVSALFAAVLAAAPAAGAVAARWVELRGDSSASVAVTLTDEVTIRCCGLRQVMHDGRAQLESDGLEVTTSGRYAGFLIERPSDGRVMAAAIRVFPLDLDDGRVPSVISIRSNATLRPGRYRIHLIAEESATVRFRTTGLSRSATYRPTMPSKVTAALLDLQEVPVGGSGRHAIDLSGKESVFMASAVDATAGQAAYVNHCVVERDALCQTDPEGRQATDAWACAGCGRSASVIYSVYRPKELFTGAADAAFTAASAGVLNFARGFVLVFG